MKKTIAIILSALMILSYYTPVLAQNAYEIVPPVGNNSQPTTNTTTQDNNVTTLPNDIGQPGQNTLQPQNTQQINSNTMAPLHGSVATAPRGTNFEVTTSTTINSISSRVGDTITATIEEPLIIDSQTVIPAGSEMIGQISFVQSAGRIGKDGLMDIRFTSVKLPNGDRVPINAKIITTDSSGVLRGGPKSNIVLKPVATAAGATAAGAVTGTCIGALVGSVGGAALFGTAVGGLVGVGYAIYRKGKEIILPSGTKLGVTLEQPLTISNSKAY